ncbi:MAG: DUF3006 domain-containing protein [Clostridiaceae bacterium]|jgi:hypothetical protein|nr:DUF3006 domain-containing protein [Clostridiaceae bacterium]
MGFEGNLVVADQLSCRLTKWKNTFEFLKFKAIMQLLSKKIKIMINLPKELVPEGAKEMDALRIEIDNEETQSRKKSGTEVNG